LAKLLQELMNLILEQFRIMELVLLLSLLNQFMPM